MPETITPSAPAAPAAPASFGSSAPAPSAPAAPAPSAPAAPASGGSQDDQLFGADISKLPPEVRPHVEPLITTWRDRLEKWVEDQKSQIETFQKRAQAFDVLAQRKDFREWYNEALRREQGMGQQPSASAPELTQEEIAAAYDDPKKWEQLVNAQVEKHVQGRYSGVIDQMQRQQQHLDDQQKQINMSLEMDAMFRAHPEAYEFDQMGILEPVIYDIVDRQGKSVEHAFKAAQRIYNSVMAKVNGEAAKRVADARGSSTAGPSTSTQGQEVIYANNPDEALRMQIEARMDGRNVKVRVKPRGQAT